MRKAWLFALGLVGCARGPGVFAPMARFAPDTFLESQRPPAQIEQVFTVSWRKDLVEPEFLEWEPREFARPAVDDSGRVYVATRDGYVRAFDQDGVPLWEKKEKGPFAGGIEVDGDKVYVPTGDGVLLALSVADGTERWRYRANEELGSRPVVANGVVYVASFADTLFAIDAETGAWKWQYRRESTAEFTIRGISTPAVDFDKVFVGFSDGSAICLDANDGAVKWQRQLSQAQQFPDVDADPQLDGNGHVAFASYKGGVFMLDEESGADVWVNNLQGVTTLLGDEGHLYAGTASAVVALSLDQGREAWRAPFTGGYGGPATLVSRYLVVPTTKALLFLDRDTGRAHRDFDPGRGISAPPAVSRNALYVISNFGYLYALSLTRPPGVHVAGTKG